VKYNAPPPSAESVLNFIIDDRGVVKDAIAIRTI